ncbi:uncharacterized protein LOC109019698 [Juglans regia]|uniref:Uncharacterized protein LOC109019698 n=1 Tax=Juglans regia TaxID=51240 RepID=A0A2I4HN55_JUGRE|nr:uncharacterized protein LOC109019698 [Juglans regia]
MISSFGHGGNYRRSWPFRKRRSSLGNLRLHESSGSENYPENVVIVMDGMEEFTIEATKWALENVVVPGRSVLTLVGVMPWLNIPLYFKTAWLDVLKPPNVNEKRELGSDARNLKLQAVDELCRAYGVVAQKKVVMGHPSRLLAVEQITCLNATWVVLDRHQRKNSQFYAKKIPCNMVIMNDGGGADMIRGLPTISSGENTPVESPASVVPTPEVIISMEFDEILKERAHEYQDKKLRGSFLVEANALRDQAGRQEI